MWRGVNDQGRLPGVGGQSMTWRLDSGGPECQVRLKLKGRSHWHLVASSPWAVENQCLLGQEQLKSLRPAQLPSPPSWAQTWPASPPRG